jgi:hypothetical protein
MVGVVGEFSPNIEDFQCREYLRTNPLREEYPFRCAIKNENYFIFSFNVTHTIFQKSSNFGKLKKIKDEEKVSFKTIFLAEDIDYPPAEGVYIDFTSNGMVLKKHNGQREGDNVNI